MSNKQHAARSTQHAASSKQHATRSKREKRVTSICGMPRGAGGMPTRSNWPSILLSDAISRSPCSTLMPTCGA
eukprot:2630920-Prymnesium_polylepis.1